MSGPGDDVSPATPPRAAWHAAIDADLAPSGHSAMSPTTCKAGAKLKRSSRHGRKHQLQRRVTVSREINLGHNLWAVATIRKERMATATLLCMLGDLEGTIDTIYEQYNAAQHACLASDVSYISQLGTKRMSRVCSGFIWPRS